MFCAYFEGNCGFGDTLNEAYEELLKSNYADSDTDEIDISDILFYKHVAVEVETKVIITEGY